ncbi:putative ribonuclease H-like domain-containing protein [Tanacetum coccineum]
MPNLEEIVYSDNDEDVDAEADMTNLDTHILVSPTLTTRIHKDHPLEQIFGDIHSAPQTRRMTKSVTDQEAMQDELLQFKLQKVWTLVDLPYGRRAIGTKWIYRNKKDERGIVVRNKARLVAQGYTQEKGIDYDEVFALVARIEAFRLFLAYASFKDIVVYQMDVKSAFLYGKIEGEVYVCQPPGFEDPEFTNRVYKVEKALYGLHQAPRACQDEYVDEILKKFGFSSVKTASTPMETSKPLMKDENAEDVDVHLYRLMIGSLMYLTSSRHDIMFVGLWYPKDSPFDLEAYTDSDYAGASLDRKSTTGSCQFLRSRLILWQCKKQTIVANSTTEAEYVAASNCCGQVIWIQNQLLDYGYNFMNTKIFIDNESTICIVKNPVFYSKTNHIEIRHHFIKDSYEKRLIQVIKIHTDHNVADLLTKAFDVSRFQYLIARWLEWSAKAAKDEIEVKTGNSKVNAAKRKLPLELQLLRALKFVDSYNMVAYLEKSSEHVDFDEIVDFLNASPIRYALIVSPTIYVSYIEQFWSTAKIKIVNNERQIHAKVDGKTIVISESSVKRDLQFNDEDGTITPLFATMLIQPQANVGEGSGQPTEPQHIPTTASPSNTEPILIIASSSQPQNTHKHRKTKRPTVISQFSGPTTLVADKTIHKERGDSMERAATIVISLDVEQGSGVNTPRSGEDKLKIIEFMEICTKLSDRVLALENVKTTQYLEITSLKKREDASKQGRDIAESEQDEDISFVQEDLETQGSYDQDIDVTTVNAPITTTGVSVSTAEPSTPPTTTTTVIKDKDLTIAQTLMKIKKPSEFETRKEVPPSQHDLNDKGKAKMIELEKPLKKKDQIKFDEEVAKRLVEELEAELEEEERVTIQREEEANLISWDNGQAMMEVDYELA